MERETEIGLIESYLDFARRRATTSTTKLSSIRSTSTSPRVFQRERDHMFARLPAVAAHVSELPNAGDFVKREIAGRSILVTRDAQGEVRAFKYLPAQRDTVSGRRVWL